MQCKLTFFKIFCLSQTSIKSDTSRPLSLLHHLLCLISLLHHLLCLISLIHRLLFDFSNTSFIMFDFSTTSFITFDLKKLLSEEFF